MKHNLIKFITAIKKKWIIKENISKLTFGWELWEQIVFIHINGKKYITPIRQANNAKNISRILNVLSAFKKYYFLLILGLLIKN